MNFPKILILWITAALLSVALLFPPFGYTGFEVNSMNPKVVAIATPQKFSVCWTYLAHKFIFEKPPGGDADFEEKMERSNETVDAFKVGISWRFVAIECAVILIFGAASFFTLGRLSK
jgi:hypothetical protein